MIYEIQMSKGASVKIDEEDLQKIKANISENLIILKQAIINPSFMIMITPTEEKEFISQPKIIEENGVAKIIGEDKIRTLADKMSANKNLLN